MIQLRIYNRKTKKVEESLEYKENLLKFLYKTLPGRLLLKTVVARPWFSKMRAKYFNSPKSKKDIMPFIKRHNINTAEWDINSFKTFNEFFTRKKTIRKKTKDNELVAIADSKLRVYNINDDLRINIKNSNYSLQELLQKNRDLSEYKNGFCLVFRLSVDDYHRYVYPDDGILKENYKIPGKLHTIRPISDKYNVFARNSREISVLETKNLGEIIQIEVGALLVGAIRNHNNEEFKKLEEKGFFEYGGSTIILLLKNNVIIDNDILVQNLMDNEVKVEIGERIGICNRIL